MTTWHPWIQAPNPSDSTMGSDAFVGNVSFKTLKVIGARQLHHKHFFSVDMDYGHKVYLEKLEARRVSTLA